MPDDYGTRLTEDETVHVLLLEAGPADRNWAIDMPSGLGRLLADDRFNWAYTSEPEPYLDNRRLSHPRGRCSAARLPSTA